MSNSQDNFLLAVPAPLLHWYDQGARVLPWRSQPTPYRVWVSEIMLQQTRVEAALPYFTRFMEALPTIESLAQAPEEQLLKLWEGLGYYSRVRNLQKAARMVLEEFDGQLPSDPLLLQKLPGIGDYSAGAIASIAYGQPVPAVDGNVLRVISRLLASFDCVSDTAVKKRLRQQVAQVIPPDRPGDFNQALMELGATVCLPNGQPLCLTCPLLSLCRGRAQGVEMSLPVKAAKKPRRKVERTVLLLWDGQQVLVRKRPAKGLLSSLWEFPGVDEVLSAEQIQENLSQRGIVPLALEAIGQHTHIFSHVEWQMTGWEVNCKSFSPPKDCTWITPHQLAGDYALPSAFRPFTQWILKKSD